MAILNQIIKSHGAVFIRLFHICGMKKVLVTGISGFLGLHIAAEGLRRGYAIRGTVRSENQKQEVLKLFSSLMPEGRIEICLANLLQAEGWDKAVEGCDGIMHVASPFILEIPKHEDDLIKPAVLGVKNVLEAALRQGVHRIVQTSSIAAIMYGHDKNKTHFNEGDWTKLEGPSISSYTKSKTLAEQEFWAIGHQNPSLQLTAINPGFVLGPLLNKDPGTSVQVLLKMMKGEYPGVPRLGFATVDVRDVALLHWNALEQNISIGKRYPAVSSTVWFAELAQMILDFKPEFSSKVKARQLPDWFVRIFALFDKPTRMILPELGFCAHISGELAAHDFGFKPRPVAESVNASVESIIEKGLIKVPG